MTALDEIVRRYREHPGLRTKRPLRIVREVLGPSDGVSGPGDDAAAIADGEGHLLLAGEAMWPPFAEADPFGAGAAAVVANVNDVAAMGGRPLGIVDTIVGPEEAARRALEGMRWAAELYGVPVVGGHLTVVEGPPSMSAFVAGRARTLLSATRVAPGQALVLACCLEGRMREDFHFFSSLRERGDRLRDDVAVFPQVAEARLAEAAKDVSMAGALGSLAMLLEPTRRGATVDLEAMPRPKGVAIEDWVEAFPTFGFWLTARPEAAKACRDAFHARSLACEVVGELDDTGVLRARIAGDEAELTDLTRDGPTGL